MSRKRRQYARVRAQSLVAHLHLDGKLVGGGPVENISAGGLLVRTGQQLPEGAVLQLDLVRPGMKKPFRVPGRVVGLSGTPPALRIEFERGSDVAAARLHGLLNELGLRETVETLAAPSALTPQAAPTPPTLRPVSFAPVAPAAPPRAPGPSLPSRSVLLPVPAALTPWAPPAAAAPAACAPEAPLSLQQQVQALQEQLRLARAQLERHERELALLRAELRGPRQ